MEFRDYASKEAAALFSRLLAGQTEASLQCLRSLRDALDAAARGIEAEAPATSQAEQEIQELVKRLNAAAGNAARIASQRVQKEAQATLEIVHDELKTVRTQNERLSASLAEARAQAEALQTALRKETDRADAADRDLDAAIEAHAQVDAARLEAEVACKQLSGELEAARANSERAQREAESALEAAIDELNTQREAAERLAATLADARALEETLRLDVQRETERADAADRDLDAAIEAYAQVDAARVEAEAEIRRHAHARAALEKELSDVRGSLDGAAAQTARLRSQLDASAGENARLTAEVSAAHAELDTARAQREAIASQLEASTVRVLTLERNQTTHQENLQQLEIGLTDALREEAILREQAASANVEIAGAREELTTLRSDVEKLVSLLDASSRAVDELSTVTTVADLFAALVKALSSEFPRVALFRVKSNRLEGEHQFGFDLQADVTKLVIPMNVDSLITRAASSGVVEELTGRELEDTSRAPFGGTPAAAIALPIVFQGETLAVVYADSDPPAEERGPAAHDASVGFAKLLVRAAVVLLMRLSQELKTLNELREYAALLMQEAEAMYGADIEAEKPDDERRSRLRDTIECARQLYAQRASLEGTAAAQLLDDRIAAAIDADPVTPFARDLAAIAGEPGRSNAKAGTADRHSESRRKAEAS